MSTAEKILSNANAVAHRYRKRAPWASFEDVRNAAVAAMCEATNRGGHDGRDGVEVGAYLWRAGLYAARREVHLSGSPVSHLHRVERLRGVRGETIFAPATDGDEGSEERAELSSEQERVDDTAHRMQVSQRVRQRVADLLGDDWVDLVLSVLGDGWTPAEIAEQNGVDVTHVYRLVRRARATLMSDRELFALWSSQ